MTINFFDTVYRSLLENQSKKLIVWPEADGVSKTFSGKQILEKIASVRSLLLLNKVVATDKVLLVVPVSPDLICVIFAIQAIGAIPVLPPAKATATSILHVIKKERVRFVLVAKAPSLLQKITALINQFQFLQLTELTTAPVGFAVVLVPPHQAALISHSSGSTGDAKAIYRSHEVLLAQHHALKEAFPPFEGQVDFPLFPNILLHNLAIGVPSVLPDLNGFKLSEIEPKKIVDQLLGEGIQTLTGNVFYYKKLLQYLTVHPTIFPEVKALGIGGSPVPEALAIALKTYFINTAVYIIYGSSEAEPIAHRKVENGLPNLLTGFKVGKVNSNLEIKFVNAGSITMNGKTIRVGEITVQGSHVAMAGNSLFLHTGDFGYLDQSGELFLTARKGNETVCAGLQHYQVEHLLSNDLRVERVAAIATEKGFKIFVEGNLTEKEILDILIKELPAEAIESINKRNSLPVDPRHLSKILYNQVR